MGEYPFMNKLRSSGLSRFIIIWVGQLFSLIGTNMTQFALTIWVWQITGEATALSLVSFFAFVPAVLVSPVAGVLVDRWNRKLAMMLSDLGAILSTIVVLLLFSIGRLEIWHLYITGAFTGFFQAFQFPAYSAAITMIVSKDQYTRASGMLSMADFGSNIFAPVVAALLLGVIGIEGILTIDILTFLIAIVTLLFIRIPKPRVSEEGAKSKGNIWRESIYGFQYIFSRRSLLGLQLIFFCMNLVITFAVTVFSPMILALTDNNTNVLGIIQSTLGLGGMLGSIILSYWGGPKRKIHGVLIGMAISMLGMIVFSLGRSIEIWIITAFFTMFFIPFVNGSSQAIWQSKVPPDVQGRVFATRSLIAQISTPVSMLLSGPLADHVFEPAMMPGGGLVPLFGSLLGTGQGVGMSLMFVIAGVLGIIVSIGGYVFQDVRNIEDILPDY